MPGAADHYEVQPDPAHKGKFRVVNTTQKGPDGGPKIHASNVSKATATKQWRLLQAIKHDPGWTPQEGATSDLKNVPGPGKYPGTGYSERPSGGRHYGNK